MEWLVDEKQEKIAIVAIAAMGAISMPLSSIGFALPAPSFCIEATAYGFRQAERAQPQFKLITSFRLGRRALLGPFMPAGAPLFPGTVRMMDLGI